MPISSEEIKARLQEKLADFWEKGLTIREVKRIAKYIMSPEAKSLTQLSVQCNSMIKEEGGEILCTAIATSPYCQLEYLNIGATEIGRRTINVLCNLLSSPSCPLRTLSIASNKRITDKEVKLLCSALINNTSLNFIGIWNCSLTDGGGLELILLLLTFKTQITSINFENLGIRSSLKAIVNSLLQSNSRYQRIVAMLNESLQISNLPSSTPVSSLLTNEQQTTLFNTINCRWNEFPPPPPSEHVTFEAPSSLLFSNFSISVEVFAWRLAFCIQILHVR